MAEQIKQERREEKEEMERKLRELESAQAKAGGGPRLTLPSPSAMGAPTQRQNLYHCMTLHRLVN